MFGVVVSLLPIFGFLVPVIGREAMANVTGSADPEPSWCKDKNCTQDVEPKYVQYENVIIPGSEPASMQPPLWCPEGYRLLRSTGVWMHVCRPMPCMSVQPTENCHPRAIETPWCTSFREILSDVFRLLSNGTLFVGQAGGLVLPHGYFRENGSVVDFCIEMDPSIETCDHYQISGKHLRLKENLDLFTDDYVEMVYPLGQYALAINHSFAIVCLPFKATNPREETMYLYGSIAVMSAVCLLLALVAHAFFPSLNYHTKSLLCMAFSLLVMYVALAVRLMVGHFSTPAANLTVFAFQYTFSLASFFWLSVIAYDLWRVFAKMKGSVRPGNNVRQKRAFVAKCVYAFGIPTVMCIIAVSIASSQSAQTQLNIVLPLKTTHWFPDIKTLFIFFYGPILFILVQNIVFFIATVVNIRRASSGTSMVHKNISRKLLRVYVKLFSVMGITWIAEVISGLAKSTTDESSWYATDLLNCLQGLFIFLIYVCKRRTLIIIKNKMGYLSDNQAAQATNSWQDNKRTVTTVALTNVRKSQLSPSNSNNAN